MPLLLAAVMLAGALLCYALRPTARQGLAPRSAGFRVDVGSADVPTLCLLPGIGPALAERIIAHREAHGPFARTADLDAVAGIGPRTLARIGPLLVFGAGTADSAPR